MVAVVSGSGLGLFGSSTSQLGGGADGKSNVGRGRDQIYVNSTNGNLIVQSVDETLSALGLDFVGARTYNSQGLTDDDNGDLWRLGVHQKVVLTGVVLQAGSVVTKTFGDGTEIKYTWNQTRSRYESNDGDGANDFLTWDGTNSRWTWTDGSTRATEEYWLISGVQRIKFSRDADGNAVTYNYNAAGLLTSLNMSGSTAQTVTFTWSGALGTNLDSIRVDSFNGTGTVAQTQTVTRYYYDASNRLKQVVVDLTPTDNVVPLPDANSDGYYEATAQQTYVTTYTYDAGSKRIASITQSDGSSVSFTYQDVNGDFRLKTVTDAENRQTVFTYADVIGGSTGTPAAWSGAAPIEATPAGSVASAPQVAFDSSGNGFAIWTVTQNTPSVSYTLKAARYTRATNTWVVNSTPLYTSISASPTASLAVDAAGNALVAWLAGGAISAVRYTSGAWGSTQSVVGSGATLPPSVSINGNFAAIIWGEGTSTNRSAQVSRWSGTAWLGKSNVENQPSPASEFAVAVDNLGNVLASWTQIEGTNLEPCVWTSQYRVSTSAWTTPVTRDVQNPTAGASQFAFDANGNGILFFQQAGSLYAVRYTRSTNVWTTAAPIATQTNPATQTSLSVDATGNAVLAWVQNVGGVVNAYAVIYTASNTTFGPVSTIEVLPNAVTNGSLKTSISGARASATWIQNDGTRDNAYAAIFDGTWQPATLIEASTNAPSAPAIAMDSQGGISALWIQSNGTAPSLYTNRFTPASSGGGGGTPAIYQTVTVTSPNASVVYKNDTQGRLEAILRSTGSTTLETRYAYDSASGNVLTITEDPTGLNRVTTFAYDPVTGVLLNSRDSLGNTVLRTYNTNSQLLTETRYTVPDPDGSGPTLPSGALTTRFAYDSEHHLRFVISADGRVTEHQYNTAGQRIVTFEHLVATYSATPFAESDLITWAGAAGAGVRERTDYRYDWRGALDRISRWATTDAAGVGTGTASLTHFVYDQRGQLQQTLDPRGAGTVPDRNNPNPNQAYAHTFTYDGLGRVLTNTEWLAPAGATPLKTRISTNTYDDASRQTQTVLANGLLTIATYNRAGELITVNNGALGTRSYVYDAAGRLRIVNTDPVVRQFSFYDDAGRLIGSVDGDGTLTELIYDKASQLIKTVRHSTLLSAATLASLVDGSGNPTAVTFASLRTEAGPSDVTDQVARRVYDNAGRLVYTIDEIGAVTKFSYDGANRLVQELRYNNTISIARATDQVLPADVVVSTHADDRLTRHFYDNSDNRIATLDGAGYLSEFTYDNAGHLMTRFERANPVAAGLRATGTLAQVQTSAGTDTETVTDPEVDITTQYYYDQQGRLSGELDGEGYYTKLNYDVAGNATTTVRYDFALTYTSRQTQATIETALVGKNSHTTTREYDGANRLVREIDFQSTVAEYEYDNDNHLVSKRLAAGDPNDERWTASRYDELGRVIRELTAEGKAAVVALGSNPPQASVDNLWNLYGVLYAYDAGGRRVTATARPNDAQTNVTRYYYDNDGRLRFEVNQLGERREYRYNALGQLTDELKYINTISTSGLNGGLLTSALLTTLTQSADATRDAKTTYTYTLRGELASKTTIEGATVANLYNSFGELRSSTPGATGFVATTYDYTARGELKTIYRGGVQYAAREYDAFGRLTKVTDGRGKISKTEYDRIGRQVATIDALGGGNSMSYDGYSRLKFTDDAMTGTNNTSYVYDDVARKMTVDTPEGVRVVTTFNRLGDVSNVTIGTGGATPIVINSKSFTYDKNGQVLLAYENGVQIEARTYDRGGRQVTQVDGRGTTTTIAYDAANRTFTSTVDSITGGLRLITTYTYDGQGRIYDVTDPRGLLTRTTYDRDGRVTQVALDPSGLNLRTTYTYDTANNTLTVTEGFGTSLPHTTQYKYDTLGRRSEEIVDPSGLNLRTQFKYDNANNMTRKVDSRLFSCWYVYDDKNRLSHKIDALGGVTQMTYDAMDRLASTRHYANYLSVGDLTTLAGTDTPTTANFTLPAAAGADALERSFYDKDGREAYTIDGVGTITQRTFDAMGNVTRLRRISATQLPGGNYADAAAVAGALGSVATTLAAADQVSWTAYDERGRAEFVLDSMNGVNANVQRLTYDGNGNVVASRQYYAARAIAADNSLATLRAWNTANLSPDNDHLTLSWYDSVDRKRYVLDAEGYLTQTTYNDTTRAEQTTRYETRPTGVTAASTISQVGTGIVIGAKDETTIDWVDAAGRARFTLDAEGYLGETQYNDTTGAVTRIAYVAKPSSAPTIGTTLATVVSTRTLTAASDRSVTTWVDAAYRQRFVLDGEKYLTETRYNDVNGSKTVFVYRQKQAQFSATSTLANLTAPGAITVDTNDQNTREDLDDAGRLSQVTDSNSKSEYYRYDGAGNKTKFVNKNAGSPTDAAFTWNYEYDANGRLVYERSPPVLVTTVTEIAGNLVVTPDVSVTLTTHTFYDAFGNITSRVEAEDLANQTRTTRYEYDALGHQVAVVSPSVGVYNPVTGDAQLGIGSAVTRTETATELRSETTYDVFGNAFRSRRVTAVSAADSTKGTYTYKAYDKLNRAIYDVNAKAEVIGYTLDAFGNKTVTTDFANPRGGTALPTGGTSLKPSDVVTGLPTDGTKDRAIYVTYDRMNRALTTKQTGAPSYIPTVDGSAGSTITTQPTIENFYNAFGEATKSRELVAGSTWANTFNYYDRRGLRTGQVDPANYFTKFDYDASGNLTAQTEYALPNTGTIDETTAGTTNTSANGAALGSDRITNFAYDKVNRRIAETRVNFEYSYVNAGGTVVPDFTNSTMKYQQYFYDAVGNVTKMIDALGAVTHTFYDVLGRVVAVASPLRDRGQGTPVMGYTRMLRDAHGVLARQIEYYDGLAAADINSAVDAPALPTTPAGNSALNHVTTIMSDKAGNALRSQDASLATRFSSYNERGDLAKEWQVVTNPNVNAATTDDIIETRVSIYRYNNVGQVTQLQETQRYSGATPVSITHVREYNTFGEITAEYDQGAAVADKQYYQYDQQGRVWRTNSGDGVDKIFMYDLSGRVTLEIRSKDVDLANAAWSSAIDAINNVSSANLMRTETVFDIRGKVVQQRLPNFDLSALFPPVGTNITVGPVAGSPVAGAYYVSWTPTAGAGTTGWFSYREVGSTANYTKVAPEVLPGGLVGANVDALYNKNYEYRIFYTRPADAMPIAESMGTFQLTRGTTTNYAIQPTTPDTSNEVSTLAIQPSGPKPLTAAKEPGTGAVWNGSTWQGMNDINVVLHGLGGPVRVIVNFTNQSRTGVAHPNVLRTFDLASTTNVLDLRWSEAPDINGIWPEYGGVLSAPITVYVYAQDTNGNYTVLIAHTNAVPGPPMLIWARPADSTITATFRYKRAADLDWSSAEAEAFGPKFRIPVQNLLVDDTTYNYEVEYWRAGTLVSKVAGNMNSTGVVTTRTISAAAIGDVALSGVFSDNVATPSVVGTQLAWAVPSQAVDATFEYNLGGGGYTPVSIEKNADWRVSLGGLDHDVTYGYKITYKIGGRLVAVQTGTFSITTVPSSTNTALTNTPGSTTPQVSDIGTLSGESNLGFASATATGSQVWDSFGGKWWMGPNRATVSFASVGVRPIRVILTYAQVDHSGNGATSRGGSVVINYPNGGSGGNVSWSDNDSDFWGGIRQNPPANLQILVEVWGTNAAGAQVMLRSSAGTGSGLPPKLSWAAPVDPSGSTLNGLFSYNGPNGSGTLPVTTSGGVSSVDLGNLAGTFSFTVTYTRAGESAPVVTRSGGTFTCTGIASSITNQGTVSNANTAPLSIGVAGSTLSWSRAAAGTPVTFRYRIQGSGSGWSTDRQPSTTDNVNYTLNLLGLSTNNYEYQVEYRTGSQPIAAFAQGTLGVTTTVTSQVDLLSRSEPANVSYPTQRVTTMSMAANSDVVSWNYAKLNASDTMTFTYYIGASQFTAAITGSGPAYSAQFAALPIAANQSIPWTLTYKRVNETNPYAQANGTATITITGAQTDPDVTITSQTPVYPSGVVNLSAPTDLGGSYFGWASLSPEAGATVTVRIDGSIVTTETVGTGRRINLTSLTMGQSHSYELTFTRSGETNPYARAYGTFTPSITTGGVVSSNLTAAAQRPDSTLEVVPRIQVSPIFSPPYAKYHLVAASANQGGPIPVHIELGAAPWTNTYGGGGWYYSTEPSDASPYGSFSQAPNGEVTGDPRDYFYYDDHPVLAWARDPLLGIEAKVEYWPVGDNDPTHVKTLGVITASASFQADIFGVAAGTYTWRITMFRTNSPIPLGVREGTLVRGTTNSVSVSAPIQPATTVAKPTLSQQFDRWGNVVQTTDAAGNVTNYRFNSLNQTVRVLEAMDSVIDLKVNLTQAVNERVEKTNSYDLLGRLIETQDGYDQATRVTYNLAGQVLTKRNADFVRFTPTTVEKSVYDIFGNQTQTVDQLGFITRNVYDKVGRLIEVWREIKIDTFQNKADATSFALASNRTSADVQKLLHAFDEAGRRVSETNGAGEVVRYFYDLSGNIVRRTTPLGATIYTYDGYGNKTSETDALGSTSTWTYDGFHRMQTHGELWNADTKVASGSAITVNSVYNEAGMLKRQYSVNSGLEINFTYDAAGNMTMIKDTTPGVNRVTNIRFDAAGRKVRETILVDDRMHQDTRTAYDAHNRIKSLDDPDYTEQITYDVNGNRARLRSYFLDFNHRVVFETLDYKYDEMNRLTGSYINPGGDRAVVMKTDLFYNARGDRTRQSAPGVQWEKKANLDYVTNSAVYLFTINEYYEYDGINRLTKVNRDLLNPGGGITLETIHDYTYDAASRMKTDTNKSIENKKLVTRTVTNNYLSDGRLDTQTVKIGTTTEQVINYGASTYDTANNRWHIGYDAAGVFRGYSVDFKDSNGGALYTTTYRNQYVFGDAYLESAQNATSTSGGLMNGDTTHIYNLEHQLIGFTDNLGTVPAAEKKRDFVNNQNGQVLTSLRGVAAANVNASWDAALRRAASSGPVADKTQYFFYSDNNLVGQFGQANEDGKFAGRFDVNTTPISSSYPDAVPSTVIAQVGDTLRIIAGRVFGDSSLWYVLAEENGLSDPDADIVDGTQLRVPNNVISLSNDAGSFKPFNVADVLGDLTPTQQPHKMRCETLSQILGVVVGIIVMIYSRGNYLAAAAASNATTQYSSLMLNGLYDWKAEKEGLLNALGFRDHPWNRLRDIAVGMSKEFIGTQIGIPIGQIEYFSSKPGSGNAAGSAIYNPLEFGAMGKFDRQSVAISVATAAAAGGVSSAFSGAYQVIGAGVGAVAGYGAQYGLSKAFGREMHFSWRDLAVSAVSAMASAEAAKYVPDSDLARGAISRVAGAAVQVFAGGKVDVAMLAVDVFGNAMADSIQRASSITAGEVSAGTDALSGQWTDADAEMVAEAVPNTRVGTQIVARAEGTTLGADGELLEIVVTGYREPHESTPIPGGQYLSDYSNYATYPSVVNPTTGPVSIAPARYTSDLFAPAINFDFKYAGPYSDLFESELRTQIAGLDFDRNTGLPYARVSAITAADDYYQAQREVTRRFITGSGGVAPFEVLGFWAGTSGQTPDPVGTYEAGRAMDELLLSGGSLIGGVPPSFTGASRRLGTHSDRTIGEQQSIRFGDLGRRINEPIEFGPTNAVSRRDFLNQTRQLKPNTVYSFGNFSYTTDFMARAQTSEGFLKLDAGKNRVPRLDASIGKSSGVKGDIGFHHGGDQFGFMGGNANLTPGSYALNSSAYKSFETRVKRDLVGNPGEVYGKFEAVYAPGNMTKRPNYYTAVVSIKGKTAYRAVFPNTPPGRRGQ